MPERERASIEALVEAAGMDWSEPLQIAGPQHLRSLNATAAVLVLLNNATLPLLPASSNAQPGIEARTASLGMFVHF